MATMRTLSTGDLILYDDKTRDLYIIEASHADQCEGKSITDALLDAKSLVKAGMAQHFDRMAVERLQQAFASVGALG